MVLGEAEDAIGDFDVLAVAVGEADGESLGEAVSERLRREQLERTTRAQIKPAEQRTSRLGYIYAL